jgi:AraC-like DNA-binding protein
VAALSQRLDFVDASQAAEAHDWLPSIHYRQISSGPFSGLLMRLDVADIQVVREQHSQDVHKCGVMPAGQCTLSFIDAVEPGARFSQFAKGFADQLFLLTEQTEFDILVPGGLGVSYVRLDQDAFLHDLAALNEPLAAQLAAGGDLQALGSAGKAAFAAVARALFAITGAARSRQQGVDSRMLHHNLREHLLLAVSATAQIIPGTDPSLHARRRALHIVRRAQAYLEAQLGQGIIPTAVEMYTAAGVSERTLQGAFHDQLGLSPSAYLRLTRLNGVRAELLAPTPDTTVTAVATRWGFLHLGRFARAYRALFREKPSDTLTRAEGLCTNCRGEHRPGPEATPAGGEALLAGCARPPNKGID